MFCGRSGGLLRVAGNPNLLAFLSEGMMGYQVPFVPRNQHRICVREHPAPNLQSF
jgi:hypothetical protein